MNSSLGSPGAARTLRDVPTDYRASRQNSEAASVLASAEPEPLSIRDAQSPCAFESEKLSAEEKAAGTQDLPPERVPVDPRLASPEARTAAAAAAPAPIPLPAEAGAAGTVQAGAATAGLADVPTLLVLANLCRIRSSRTS